MDGNKIWMKTSWWSFFKYGHVIGGFVEALQVYSRERSFIRSPLAIVKECNGYLDRFRLELGRYWRIVLSLILDLGGRNKAMSFECSVFVWKGLKMSKKWWKKFLLSIFTMGTTLKYNKDEAFDTLCLRWNDEDNTDYTLEAIIYKESI